jgi:hypothetical protein
MWYLLILFISLFFIGAIAAIASSKTNSPDNDINVVMGGCLFLFGWLGVFIMLVMWLGKMLL